MRSEPTDFAGVIQTLTRHEVKFIVDLLGEVAGGGTYEALLPHADAAQAFGTEFLCVGLARLIQLKRAAGRPRDLESIAELQALLEERRKHAGQ